MTSTALRRWRSGPSVALDLGTAWGRAQACGDPRISTEPSTMRLGPHVPSALEQGVVRNVPAASAVVRRLLARLPRWGWRGPRVLACVPFDTTRAERQALTRSVQAAGADDVTLILEPVAAAIGAGGEFEPGAARMVVDIGEGVTDAVVCDGQRVVAGGAVRVGCGQLRRVVRTALSRGYAHVGEEDAERVLRAHGVAGAGSRAGSVAGPLGSMPVEALHAELADSMSAIAACVAGVLRGLSDRARAEVIESGIVITGGGALLPGMPQSIEDATQVPTRTADDPLHAVIRGAGAVLTDAARTGRWPVRARA